MSLPPSASIVAAAKRVEILSAFFVPTIFAVKEISLPFASIILGVPAKSESKILLSPTLTVKPIKSLLTIESIVPEAICKVEDELKPSIVSLPPL